MNKPLRWVTILSTTVLLVAASTACRASDSSDMAAEVESVESTTASATSAAATSGPTTSTVGSETTTTTAVSSTAAPESTAPPPDGLQALVDGHNDLTADRINLVFAPWGWDDLEAFVRLAETYLGWDQGAQLFGPDGSPVATSVEATSAELGLFGFEPFRSHTDKFNVWITTIAPPTPTGWLNNDTAPFDLPDQTTITLALDANVEVPGLRSVAGQDVAFTWEKNPARQGSDSVADVMVLVYSANPSSSIKVVSHELGHALFGFSDEYVGRLGSDGAPPRPDAWPSCAASLATAERWWSDLIGEYDPMIDVWATELAAVGFAPEPEEVDFFKAQNTIAYVEGGCWGDPDSVRSTEDSMMGFELPAFGLTNRRAAEQILELWTG